MSPCKKACYMTCIIVPQNYVCFAKVSEFCNICKPLLQNSDIDMVAYVRSYKILQEKFNDETFIMGLDESLRAIHEQAVDNGVCLRLAQRYKDKAVSDGSTPDDYIKSLNFAVVQ